MSFFSRVFRSKDGSGSKKQAKQNGLETSPPKPKWTDAWARTEVNPDEVQELIHGCTIELKARGLDIPFLLLPFRPRSDPSAARTFIRNYFTPPPGKDAPVQGEALLRELRLTEPMVLCSVIKWCWSRLPGGVVTWEAYELFKVGEQDSQLARDAFSTFIPLSVESDARTRIIFDFFDLMAALAAHGKSNGLGGRKLSRYAGWWAFEHSDTGNGFEAGYKNWATAADATSHLFFAYLRSLSPDSLRGTNGIATLPISLQTLVQATEYPPETPTLLQLKTTKVIMIVDTVSPTPFALLRRAKNFQYRDSDYALQKFSNYDDPVRALTEECHRVLRSISSTNQSAVSSSKVSTSLRDASWSRFEDIGFSDTIEESEGDDDVDGAQFGRSSGPLSLRSAPQSRTADLGRPTTPSWADFLSSGFADEAEAKSRPPFLLPPDKVLPPIQTVRGQSSQSHKRSFDTESVLEPGELASITTLDLDDSFWWVWISSLSGEESPARKAVFGRCALLETIITGGKWLILEEQVKGAAPEPEAGAYIAEKKSFFGFKTKRGRLTRRKSSAKKIESATRNKPYQSTNSGAPLSKTSIGPDQHARIQAAAAALQRKHREEQEQATNRRARTEDGTPAKTNSVLSMQPLVMSEASQALKWASNYDKNTVRAAYLGNSMAGTGAPAETLILPTNGRPASTEGTPATPAKDDAPTTPPKETEAPVAIQDEPPAPPEKSEADRKPAPSASLRKPADSKPADPKPQPTTQTSPKKSFEASEDPKKLKKKPGNSGLKGMFGRKKAEPASKSTGADPTSAVAAARAALEGRTTQTQTATAPSTPNSTSHRLSVLVKKKAQEAAAAQPKQVTPSVAQDRNPTPEPVSQPAPAEPNYDGPPYTRKDAEYDALSRVDTNERAQADREFSNFDHQSPFVDQPAFVPEDTPTKETSPEHTAAAPQSAETETNSTNGFKNTVAADDSEAPVQDRWAQIRKNAAERAGRQDDAPVSNGPTEKSDEGDTSGEETIESRVARIKARVAELTGNMEAAR
ncbi:hypothetical protein AJ80_02112 [Polytolypa hystricis UAMH7299]|uniref:Meiotically up-regulated protein Msb1/Mug8 domain-containing protein n=1 Tax=Polytolypa hystricis (strain UAMH7299) TaxID=1447883 RepID=A0A2B7YIE6_POLH7|nr:hypothetical protein AJ80_02112 [Polytolypa hystricis UAMH7299]